MTEDTPPRVDSPAPALSNAKKRKQLGTPVPSGTPEPGANGEQGAPGPIVPAPDAVALPGRHILASRARLQISRFPTFPEQSTINEYYLTDQIVQNQLGFRYTPAGIAEPGSAVQVRTIESNPASYRVSWEDRSPFIRITSDALGIQGDKGFRTARGNAPIREGKWYLEAKVVLGGGDRDSTSQYAGLREGAHVRLGWSRREAPLNGPVGGDGYSYGIRDKTGEKTTMSRPKPYCQTFGTGDVIGMYISLPPLRKPEPHDPYDPANLRRERIPLDYKGQEYFEALEYPQTKEMTEMMENAGKPAISESIPKKAPKGARDAPGKGPKSNAAVPPALRPLPKLGPDSYIAFFVNGVSQGVAFNDLYDFRPLRQTNRPKTKDRGAKSRMHKENPYDDGTLGYYPAFSLFNGARVRLNPGPNFDCPPPDDIDGVLFGSRHRPQRTWKPVSERYPEYMKEQWYLDQLDEAAGKVNLAENEIIEKEEEEARKTKEKRAAQAVARKIAKKAEADAHARRILEEEMTLTLDLPKIPNPMAVRPSDLSSHAIDEPVSQPDFYSMDPTSNQESTEERMDVDDTPTFKIHSSIYALDGGEPEDMHATPQIQPSQSTQASAAASENSAIEDLQLARSRLSGPGYRPASPNDDDEMGE